VTERHDSRQITDLLHLLRVDILLLDPMEQIEGVELNILVVIDKPLSTSLAKAIDCNVLDGAHDMGIIWTVSQLAWQAFEESASY